MPTLNSICIKNIELHQKNVAEEDRDIDYGEAIDRELLEKYKKAKKNEP